MTRFGCVMKYFVSLHRKPLNVMFALRRLCLVLVFFVCRIPAGAQLVINELMQSNVDCIMDDLNDFPDSWVELYNSSDVAVNLAGYKLGIDNDAKTAWPLPNKELQPGEHILICCDKVGSNAETGIHTDFRLESGKGGSVFLFQGEVIIDQLIGLKKQPAPNISYGRETDGSDVWGYMLTPTPGENNGGGVSEGILGSPTFSANGCVMQEGKSLTLNITVPKSSPQETLVRYTTDGSEPTAESPVFTAPITISSNTVVRAKLFCEGWLSPRSVTQSYLYLGHEMTIPVVSIVTDERYMTDEKIGIYVEGSYSDEQYNYKYNWRRPINLEYFTDVDKDSEFNQLCETRIQGNDTRRRALKSLAVYAHKRFGAKRFAYEFFPDQRPGVTDFKSFIMRNAGDDFTRLYMRDAIIQRSMGQRVDLDWQAWRPAVIFINGIYKGILNIRERSNADNIYTHYNGLEDIDMVENWRELKEGDLQSFNAFKAFYSQDSHTLEEYAKWVDYKEFINLMIMGLYFDNKDFPGNNTVMWRPRADGGVWRFITKDNDFGISGDYSAPDYNTIAWLYDNGYDTKYNWANKPNATLLFRQLMKDEEFACEFIDKCAVYMGDFMNLEGISEIWDRMYEEIMTEYPYHKALYKISYNYEQLRSEAKDWVRERTGHFYRYLAEFYNLGTPVALKINTMLGDMEREKINITVNDVPLVRHKFDGKFFEGRDVTLRGTLEDGNEVEGWLVETILENGEKVTEEIDGSEYSFTMPECQLLSITAKKDASGILTHPGKRWQWRLMDKVLIVDNTEPGVSVQLYTASGMCLYSAQSGGTGISIPVNIHAGGLLLLKVGSETIKIRTNLSSL